MKEQKIVAKENTLTALILDSKEMLIGKIKKKYNFVFSEFTYKGEDEIQFFLNSFVTNIFL